MPLTYSNRFIQSVKYGHTIYSYVQLLANGLPQQFKFQVTSGEVKEDATVNVRTQASATFVDKSRLIVPSQQNDLLYPGVNELQFFRGIKYPDGTTEVIPLGVFGFEDVNIHDSGESLSISVECFDRSKKVANARFPDVWIVPDGSTIASAILAIVSPRVNRLVTDFSYQATVTTINATQFDRGDDPWAACQTIASSGGQEVLFGRSGELIIRPIPSIDATPKWSFLDGAEAVVLESTKILSAPAYNHVYEIAEGGDIVTPFYAESKDNWSISNIGDRPVFHVSSLYRNTDQCQAAADAKIQQIRGTTEQVDLQLIPNPAIASSDVCEIVNDRTKTNSVSIIDKVTTPLSANNGQYLNVRKRTID